MFRFFVSRGQTGSHYRLPACLRPTLRCMRDTLAREAAAFLSPSRLYERAEMLGQPCPVPTAAGVYGWWFRRLPAAIDITECRRFQGHVLLYTGISPRRPPANGRPASRESIRGRIQTRPQGRCGRLHPAQDAGLPPRRPTRDRAAPRWIRHENDLPRRRASPVGVDGDQRARRLDRAPLALGS